MNQILEIMILTRAVWCCECLMRKQNTKTCYNNAQIFFSENSRSVGLFSLKLKDKVLLSK